MIKKLTKKQIFILSVMIIILITGIFTIVSEYRTAKDYSFDLSAFTDRTDSPAFSLPSGSFSIEFFYTTGHDLLVSLRLDNDNVQDVLLPSSEGSFSYPFMLDHPTDRAKLSFYPDAPEDLNVTAITLHADHLLFTDPLFHLAILVTVLILLTVLSLYIDKLPSGSVKTIAFLTVTCIIVNIPLYIGKGSNFGVDTRAHMLRIEGIMTGLLDHQLPVIISPNYLNEFGELSFLYPDLFLYPFALLRLFGVSMFTVYRFAMAVINILTVLSIYYSAKCICNNDKAVCASVILYTFEAHRLRIMFMNGAGAGAGIASVFIPLCIAGYYLILTEEKGTKNNRGLYLLAFGITGIMQSHIMTLLLMAAFIVILSLCCIKTLLACRCEKLLILIRAAGLTLLMNAGFLIIFIRYYFSGWSSAALLWSDFVSWLLTPAMMFTSAQSLFYMIMLLTTTALLIKKRGSGSPAYRYALTLTLICTVIYIMSTTLFPWGFLMEHSSFIYTVAMFIQQAHRFYTLIAAPVIMAPLLLFTKPDRLSEAEANDIKHNGIIYTICCSLVCLILLFGVWDEMRMYFGNDLLLHDAVTGDYNSELLLDYVPSGTDEESVKYDTGTLSDESSVESLSYSKRGTHINYSYICHAPGVYADFPLLYYPGYEAADETGALISIRKGENGHILADLKADDSTHSISLAFKVNRFYTISWLLSLIFLCVVIIRYFRLFHAGKH